jgi:ubiquinone/menaquinone biosynthesis C-methylase UbiE
LSDAYLCQHCDSQWPISQDIPRFARSEAKWSVFDKTVAEEVTALAERTTWRQAIKTYAKTIGDYTLRYIDDESRADWQILLPLGPEATVLDIGSGWGNIAISLSRWCKRVYCCDVNMLNLRLLKTRLRDRGVDNITAFQYEPNDFMRLPIQNASIDVAVLNGVLEWMGVADIDASPDQIQAKALEEIRRVLKPNGVLYIGIENRYSLSTLRGQRIHGELPFVGLLPRWMSEKLTRLLSGESHRTYIYSIWGYRKLLRCAGFKRIDFYWPHPSYHYPNYLIPLQPGWLKRYWFDRLSGSRSKKYKLAQRLGLSRLPFHWLAYSYGIRCSK